MIYILVGTDRPASKSLTVAKTIENLYKNMDEDVSLLQLEDLALNELNGSHYSSPKPAKIEKAIHDLLHADGLVVVCPEYNGSMPGILKLFIDQMKYPESFENRPVCFVGLGGRFGGLRPVEHLQQIFGYRNSFIYPHRVFIQNVWNLFKGDTNTDPLIQELLEKQAQGFRRFIRALKSENLHGGDYKS